MDWDTIDLDTALQLVAERRLFVEMRKKAAGATDQQSARQTLGALGTDEGVINDSLGKLRRGQIQPSAARRHISSAVPGASTQLANIPAAMGVAAQQGRPGEALAQADVLGLKGLVPGAENFSPTTAMAALGLGGGVAGLQSHIRKNRELFDILHRRGPELAKNDVLAGLGPEMVHPEALGKWRADNVPKTVPEQWNSAWKPELGYGKDSWRARLKSMLGGAKDVAKHNLAGPQNGQVVLPEITAPSRVPGKTPHVAPSAKIKSKPVTRGMLELARKNMPAGTLSRLGMLGIPLAAAAAPLAAREWLGSGYRSGKKPIKKLVEGNKPKE